MTEGVTDPKENCYVSVLYSGTIRLNDGRYANIGVNFAPKLWNDEPFCKSAYFNEENEFIGEKAIESILGFYRAGGLI